MRTFTASAILMLALSGTPGIARAQATGYTITGGLSNFDVTNRSDHECDEFEIEIEDCHPSDIYHTYRNGNYGSPMIEDHGTFCRIRYHHPQHLTPVGVIEHFGVSLRNFNPGTTVIRVRWMRNGHPALVNGSIPNPYPGGGTAQNTQPRMPAISTENHVQPNGDDYIILHVTNTDPAQSIWVKRSATVTAREVTLEELMSNDPLVTGSVAIDSSALRLGPGQTLTLNHDLFELEDTQSAVFNAEYFQDVIGSGGPFGGGQPVRGPSLGHVMTASVAAQRLCGVDGAPVIVGQPEALLDDLGASGDLSINVTTTDVDPVFEWRKDGVAIDLNDPRFVGADSDSLRIPTINAETVGIYYCVVSNVCGTAISQAAEVRIIGDEGGGGGPDNCPSDFNNDGALDPDDLGDFINGYFATAPDERCDQNRDGTIDPDDLGDFINEYFGGCA
ncbi:MAG: hypothetical protein AB7K52_13105 [Phycisphaerales bacterium]